jgi:hypothetical protein
LNPLLLALGDLTEWFELMDDYRGAERDRAKYLCDQFTAFGDEISHDDWVVLMHQAELLIAEWKARKTIAETAENLNRELLETAGIHTLSEATAYGLDRIIRTVRRVA